MGNNRPPVLIFCAVIFLLGGCGLRHAAIPEGPLLTVSLKELKTHLEDRTDTLRSLKALLAIRPKAQPSVTASLLIARSDEDNRLRLRLKGFNPLGRTLFDSVASGDRVRILIPDRQRIIEGKLGDMDSPSLPVKPQELFGAIWAAMGPWVGPDEIPVLEQRGAIYLLQLIRVEEGEGRIVRRLWFERRQLRLIRAELFGNGIRTGIVVDFGYGALQKDTSGVKLFWPDVISIKRYSDEFKDSDPWGAFKKVNRKADLVLEFREVHFNIEILPKAFQLP